MHIYSQVDVSSCDYLIDLDFPLHPGSSTYEPRYAVDESVWERVTCDKFLDARHSSTLTRILWMPGTKWNHGNEYGDYCLLRNKKNVEEKEKRMMVREEN